MDGSEGSEINEFSSNLPEQNNLPAPEHVSTLPTVWYSKFLTDCVSTIPSNDLVQYADVVVEKLPQELSDENTHEYRDAITALSIGEETVSFFDKLASSTGDTRLRPETIENLFNLINHPNSLVRRFATKTISPLIFLDNKNGQESQGIAEKVNDSILQKIVNPTDDSDFTIGVSLLKYTLFPKSDTGSDLFFKVLDVSNDESAYKRCIAAFSIAMGLDQVRALMREHAQTNSGFKQKYDDIEAALGFVPGKTYDDLRRLYDEINFQDYTPNEQLNDHDENFLLSFIQDFEDRTSKNDVKVLDIGTGPGRHIDRLTQKGINVVGFDFVKKHADQVKQTNPKAQAMVADWHKTPFRDGIFDVAYCLGRSSSHNTRIEDYVRFLEETNRIMTDNGLLLIDTPDSESPYYKEQIERIRGISRELGIPEIIPGIIIDSPDGVNYFDRLVPSKDQFRAIARIAGFEAEEVESQQYEAQEGAASNIYWNLTKVNDVLSPATLASYYRMAYGEEKFNNDQYPNDSKNLKAA